MGKLPFEKERKLITKRKTETDERFGKRPEERSVEEHIKYGIINLDKPRGPTSHEVVAWVKKILNVKKAGHGGTLDPKVSGVLPIAIEESTKIVQTILPAAKEYVCVMHLHGDVEKRDIKRVFKEFEGEIIQRPPIKSAVKRRLRTRRIYYLELIEFKEKDVLFRVGCDAGTYIRKLCHDIGEVLGCGAHMKELRRTKSGSFTEETLVTLHDVVDAYKFWKDYRKEEYIKKVIRPVEEALIYTPKVVIRDSAVDAICHGADLAIPGIVKVDSEIEIGDLVGIFTLKGELVAIGEALMDTKTILMEDYGIAVKTKRVLMKPSTYPRMWKRKNEE
ncbi:MAG: RNA-guided pseudouridylation complex pseudouridine synthase subunit Cbf5 [Candidatus Hydrothermarchaeota archaeon]|nr:MAG: RNA-guided pseudouridylation complex pseudouridine synthase subunit Cbf5 [Candidatus Hydrothermarchaeota archaeon]